MEHLKVIHNSILELRASAQCVLSAHLRQLILPARAVAKRFDQAEMLILLQAYEALPISELRAIEVDAADPYCTEDVLDGAFSQCLASFLVYFLTCECDFRLASLI